ncbi:MAG TPA: PLP-dependent transferase [Thermoanaerobaculia bacterium]
MVPLPHGPRSISGRCRSSLLAARRLAARTSHGLTQEERRADGVTPGLVRLSVGCEDLDDLRADLEQALVASEAASVVES